MSETKIIVLDDDPTGSQTVHGCLLLTRWDPATLKEAVLDRSPLFFVLTNTRGMSAERAALVTREVCKNLEVVLAELDDEGKRIEPVIVSRSDSTLRGHYPIETDVIAEELGPFDAHFLVPAFFEGGRFTRGSVHYVKVGGEAIPAHETEFAKDSVFGYSHSFLPDYVEEKTKGRIAAAEVERFVLEDLHGELSARLEGLEGNRCVVVDAEEQGDLDRFCEQLLPQAAKGKRFLFRSAASLLTSLAHLPRQPVAPTEMRHYVRGGRPGAVVVGSHVRKTTLQLQELLRQPGVEGIEVDVDRIASDRELLFTEICERLGDAYEHGKTSVVFTTRTERLFDEQADRLAFGEQVSSFLMDVVRALPEGLGFLISKGGITSNDVLSDGLALRASRVLGQILPGCSVVRCPDDHPRFPGLPVVIFPGNVGDEDAVAEAYRRLRG